MKIKLTFQFGKPLIHSECVTTCSCYIIQVEEFELPVEDHRILEAHEEYHVLAVSRGMMTSSKAALLRRVWKLNHKTDVSHIRIGLFVRSRHPIDVVLRRDKMPSHLSPSISFSLLCPHTYSTTTSTRLLGATFTSYRHPITPLLYRSQCSSFGSHFRTLSTSTSSEMTYNERIQKKYKNCFQGESWEAVYEEMKWYDYCYVSSVDTITLY